jgi:hypothetical protein
MAGKNVEHEVRYAVDTVLRSRGYDNHAADAEIYQETLDELTAEIMTCVGQAAPESRRI